MTPSMSQLLQVTGSEPTEILELQPTPKYYTTTELKERLKTDAFVARAHFQREFQALLREALPHVVTEEDLAGLMAPHVAGSPLPVGAVTQLFPMMLDTDDIMPHPSPGMCKDGDALLAIVNSKDHARHLREALGKKCPLPDYVGFASVEVDSPLEDQEGKLVGGSYVMTLPSTYYPTTYCRARMRLPGILYPAKDKRKAPPSPCQEDQQENRPGNAVPDSQSPLPLAQRMPLTTLPLPASQTPSWSRILDSLPSIHEMASLPLPEDPDLHALVDQAVAAAKVLVEILTQLAGALKAAPAHAQI